MTLFPVDPIEPTEPARSLSADRRRTLRQQQMIANGVHPVTRRLLRPQGGTCGDCAHLHGEHHHNRTYYKCDLTVVTNGAATDIRLSWPACNGYADTIASDARG